MVPLTAVPRCGWSPCRSASRRSCARSVRWCTVVSAARKEGMHGSAAKSNSRGLRPPAPSSPYTSPVPRPCLTKVTRVACGSCAEATVPVCRGAPGRGRRSARGRLLCATCPGSCGRGSCCTVGGGDGARAGFGGVRRARRPGFEGAVMNQRCGEVRSALRSALGSCAMGRDTLRGRSGHLAAHVGSWGRCCGDRARRRADRRERPSGGSFAANSSASGNRTI